MYIADRTMPSPECRTYRSGCGSSDLIGSEGWAEEIVLPGVVAELKPADSRD